MLQSGVMTRDLDVRWVSSLSWYFLNLFGLQSVFIFILGNDNGIFLRPITDVIAYAKNSVAANQMAQQMSQMNPGAAGGILQPGVDPDKLFQSEVENLEVVTHEYILKGVEDRLLATAKV